jgi:hypothetical protein
MTVALAFALLIFLLPAMVTDVLMPNVVVLERLKEGKG